MRKFAVLTTLLTAALLLGACGEAPAIDKDAAMERLDKIATADAIKDVTRVRCEGTMTEKVTDVSTKIVSTSMQSLVIEYDIEMPAYHIKSTEQSADPYGTHTTKGEGWVFFDANKNEAAAADVIAKVKEYDPDYAKDDMKDDFKTSMQGLVALIYLTMVMYINTPLTDLDGNEIEKSYFAYPKDEGSLIVTSESPYTGGYGVTAAGTETMRAEFAANLPALLGDKTVYTVTPDETGPDAGHVQDYVKETTIKFSYGKNVKISLPKIDKFIETDGVFDEISSLF